MRHKTRESRIGDRGSQTIVICIVRRSGLYAEGLRSTCVAEVYEVNVSQKEIRSVTIFYSSKVQIAFDIQIHVELIVGKFIKLGNCVKNK